MTPAVFLFSKTRFERGEVVVDAVSGLKVLDVDTPHALIQAAGYLKHVRAKEARKGVFFRGQRRLYQGITPTLLRGIKKPAALDRKRALIDELLKKIQNEGKALTKVDLEYHEALLQHYGINTTWLDVVDNIWVALWFACYRAQMLNYGGSSYLHFEKRVPRQNPPEPEYAYVLLIESAFFDGHGGRPGHYKDERSETVDLRVATPSHFIRPHAQHGLVVRRLSNSGRPVPDCSPMHVGTIRVELQSALDWLGEASTLATHALFPPAFYDYGYRELLENISPTNIQLGKIHRVQP
jgi:hypothetical protein